MNRIFISYARPNEAFARRLAASLSDAGASVWLDVEDIPAGMNWSSAIQEGLDSADLMIVVITPESMASRNVENEWQYFLDENKLIIPVLLKPARVHFQLRRAQYVDFQNENNYDATFRRLHAELKRNGVRLNALPAEPITAPVAIPQPPVQRRSISPYVVSIALIAVLVIVGIVFLASRPTDPPTQPATQAIVSAPTTQPAPPTDESTPDLNALVVTRQSELATQHAAQTATASSPTPTITLSPTPDIEATVNAALTATASSPTPSPTIDPLQAALTRARSGVTTNADWQPFSWTFEDNVEMVLVPVGCFMMGSEDGDDDEQPVHQLCFDEPFWIDKYEVTNEQFNRLGGQAANPSNWTDSQRPREQLTWFEARDFCALRGARLPTEAEWEYAARGPDGLIYPWGNDFVAENVVYASNSNDQTAPVGGRGNDASWVGAHDLSGNVYEWVSTVYDQEQFPYPYKADDGREDLERTDVFRVLRGDSWDDIGVLYLRAANRSWFGPDYGINYRGVRCARL